MSLNTQSLQPIINFLWTVADDVLVNTYQKGKYKDVILPMVVIRRLDLLLEPTKDQVLKTYTLYKDKLQNLDSLLTNSKHGSGLAFYNTSPFTLKKLLQDPKNLRSNFENYLNGFSENVKDIINKFKFRNEIETLDEAQILFSLIEKFCSPRVELHPNKLPPLAMGYVYEDLVRRFNEENNEEAGEHFTPREIIDLMTHLVFMPVRDKIKHGTYLAYDPCVGSGGMLTIAKQFLLNPEGPIKSNATVHLYGQESTPFIYATCKSDMLIKGEDPNKIAYGSTLSAYGFPSDLKFDFMLTNPPYGKTWKADKKALGVGEKGKIIDKRFILNGSYKKEAVTSRVNDGQLMFVLHMISKMKDTELGSRIASVHNGSALFTGDAGQGESEIRKYIIKHDLLEAIIALPNDMFYNTGIPTYIFLITNRKPEHRQGKVQLINATSEKFYYKMRKPLGKKRVEFSASHIPVVERMFLGFEENEYSKIFDNTDFGYAQITVHRPLRLMVQFTPQKVASLRFVSNNSVLREKVYKEFGNEVYERSANERIEQWLLNYFLENSADSEAEEDENDEEGSEITIASLSKKKQKVAKQVLDVASWKRDLELHHYAKELADVFCDKLFTDFNVFKDLFEAELKKQGFKLSTKDKKDIINTVGWTDPEAEAVIKKENKDVSIEYVSDPALKDFENIPLKEDIQEFFETEVLPFAPDAWWNAEETKIGYEVNFAKYFYIHQPPRPLSEIAEDIFAIETETEGLLKEIIS